MSGLPLAEAVRGPVRATVTALTLAVSVAAAYYATRAGLVVVMLGGVLFLFLSFTSFRNPERMLLCLLFVSVLLPMDLAIKPGNLPRIGPTRVLMGAFYFGVLLRIFINKRLHDQGRADFPLAVLLTVYLASAFASAATSVSPLTSVYAVIGRELFEQFLLFYIVLYYLRVPGFFERMKTVLYWATILVCLFAFVEVVIQDNPLLGFYEDAWIDYRLGIPRCRSTFFHPIAMACYLNLVFPFILVDFTRPGTGMQRAVRSALFVAVLVTSALSVSRGPWICMGIEAGIFLLWRSWRHTTRMVLVGTALGLSLAVGMVAYNTSAPVNKLLRPMLDPASLDESSSEYYRWVVVKAVWEKMDRSRILFGFGPNAFHLSNVQAEYSDHIQTLKAPDQHYARLVFEYGLCGGALFCLLLLRAVGICARGIRRGAGGDAAWAVGALMAVVGFISVNMTVSMFPMYPLGMLFWLWVAVARAAGRPGPGLEAAGEGA